ncbi:hypothetical protein [Nostoc sp. DedQUE09]|uniref:hypothetical protein n=1 Tax=Nostoc sp. DedQUE09 TaxID=3075394 RepID=UPI002AD3175D|nr:hypothetical protein [Nostoc sp. DedQUE09]MDZ7953337.1 hypothetical protein [Nostoc sp. DedQUE09]MDZ7953365.1 hypothetical protein [Nostoc sp. DedQUE09]
MLKQIKDLGTEKIIPDDTDVIAFQQTDGLTGHISRANFLSGISGDGDYPTSFTHWHDESIILSGNSLIYDITPSYTYGLGVIQHPPSSSDSFKWSSLLDAGNYGLNFLVGAGSNRGIGSLYINGILAHNDLDLYAPSTSSIILKRNITINNAGLHEFKINVSDKNISSSNYYFVMTKAWGSK